MKILGKLFLALFVFFVFFWGSPSYELINVENGIMLGKMITPTKFLKIKKINIMNWVPRMHWRV